MLTRNGENREVAKFYAKYYDVSQLLQDRRVLLFRHRSISFTKERRFTNKNLAIPIQQNQTFLLEDAGA
jgi:hypothetical protein